MHPILFEIPTPGLFWGDSLPIYSYGVMLGTSLIVAWFIVMWLGEREGLERETLANTFIVTAVCAIFGARFLYIITNPHEFQSFGDLINLRAGGLVAYGGFLGGFLGALGYLRSKKKSLLAFADVTAPTLALGLALTRIGCYLYGCDFGAPLEQGAPQWLVDIGTFPHWANDAGSPAWSHHVAQYDLEFDAEHSLPVHPTQLYESLAGLVLLGGTIAMWRMRSFRGQVLLALAMLYGVWRFGIEYVRDDPERGAAFGFSTSQLISLAIIPVAAFVYHQMRKQQLQSPQHVMRLGAPETYRIPELAPIAANVVPSASAPDAQAKRSGAVLKKKPRTKR